ncbi:MAG: hypothetical protein IIV23_11125, partial [Ruminococcus sp.]|nr:hypothetical protein [Ruminococcus sp.]
PLACAMNAQGNDLTTFVYEDFSMESGKPGIPGLPATYAESPDEATTLSAARRSAAFAVTTTPHPSTAPSITCPAAHSSTDAM